jgi:hypothetical protein
MIPMLNNFVTLTRALSMSCTNPPINGTSSCPESSQVGTSTPRPMPKGAGGGQGGLGGAK